MMASSIIHLAVANEINKTSEIIENSKSNKAMVFDMESISKFIDLSVKLIISNLEEIC